MDELNKYQQQAVALANKINLVNSAVGSGKTTVLIHKIIYLCEEQQIAPEKIVVLTFTRKAAKEIKTRLAQENTWSQDLKYCGTFHSVANHLLREHLDVEKADFKRDFSIIEQMQRIEILTKLKRQHQLRVRKYALTSSEEYLNPSPSGDIAKLFSKYQDYKKANNALDFDDLICHLNMLLDSQKLKFSWVIVDEFQDTDKIQAQILQKLIDYGAKLFAVGDPNQTIYSWRGSFSEIFSQFSKQKNAAEIALPLNYRSTATILTASQALLKNTSIKAFRSYGSPVTIKEHHNSFNEATYLAHKIQALKQQGIALKKIAILYRRQAQGDIVEEVLRKAEIPITLQRHKNIKDYPVLEWFYALLNVCFNKQDEEGLNYVLEHRKYVPKRAQSKKLRPKIEGFCEYIREPKNTEQIWQYFALEDYLKPTSLSFAKEKQLLEFFLQQLLPHTEENFAACFLKNIQYCEYDITEIIGKLESSSSDGVRMLTLHSSKGLEFSHVFIIGVNEGNMPLKGIDDEEEKRLFFVGLTRAEDYAEVSFANNPELYGASPKPSRYLQLLEQNSVRWEVASKKGNLQELAQTVKKEKVNKTVAAKIAIHQKYGRGSVLEEDEENVRVDFPGYGEKSFSKLFCPLEFE